MISAQGNNVPEKRFLAEFAERRDLGSKGAECWVQQKITKFTKVFVLFVCFCSNPLSLW